MRKDDTRARKGAKGLIPFLEGDPSSPRLDEPGLRAVKLYQWQIISDWLHRWMA